MIEETIDLLIEQFSVEKFILKTLEEYAESSEVLLKVLTKSPERQPPREKIVEELGDVLFRVQALCKKMGITEEVQARKEAKALQLNNWIKTF
jgi:NTP pyrophosphatase (non-canonical NTP hydrolase)